MARTKRSESEEVDRAIAFCKIHPAIGIARVGDSPDEFFMGPEVPGKALPPAGGYKDRGDPVLGIGPRVKRQAARFRIFAYDKDGKPLRELGSAEAEISWTVHLVNSKAEGDNFAGTVGEELPIGQRQADRNSWRNHSIDDRASLIIDPGSRTVDFDRPRAAFDGGTFRGIPVPLGELRVDENGHLLVLGGFGASSSSNPDQPIRTYANNDLWHDDVSDGPVTATVTLRSGLSVNVVPAWVIVAPPDFAPSVTSVVTLYDIALDVAMRKLPPENRLAPGETVSFSRDIAPIFERMASLVDVQQAGRGGGSNVADFFSLDELENASKERKQAIFDRFRTPDLDAKSQQARDQATADFLPALSGDSGDATEGDYNTWLHLTPSQYALLKVWVDGGYGFDWKQGRPEDLATDITPEGLDRAALDACNGGAFYPGIEAGWLLRNPDAYSEPFRLSHDRLKPGDATRHMACPWQADFFECNTHWWPAQRPDEVLTNEAYRRLKQIEDELAGLERDSAEYKKRAAEGVLLQSNRSSWSRGLPTMSPDGDEAMIEMWGLHGFVVSQSQDGERFELDGLPVAVETDRGKYDGLSWPEYFNILTNIEQHPDFASKAKELAKQFFAGADFERAAVYAAFDYTPSALDERMKSIYDAFVAEMNEAHWLDSGQISWDVVVRREGDKDIMKSLSFDLGSPFSKRVVIERLRQMAPFNLVDGAWLQRIQAAGPVDEIRAHLFAIWDDEAGNGRPDQNHCNVYDTLLRSLNIYMPPIASEKFVEQDLLESAFIQPVFQMVVSLFPEEFFPELLGMTLYLEWEASPTLTPAVRMLRNRGIDPHFYSLHVAIDNITAGHGFLAKEAIKLYLQKMEDEGGEETVQLAWQRIWRGYVTWATAGGLGSDMIERFLTLDQKQIDLSYPAMLLPDHISKSAELAEGLQEAAKGKVQDPFLSYLIARFARYADKIIRDASDADLASANLTAIIVDEFNRIVQGKECIYSVECFDGKLKADTSALIFDKDKHLRKLEGEDLVRANRLLLRDGLPSFVADIPKLEPKLFPDYREFYKQKFVEVVRRKAYAAKPLHTNIQVKISAKETYNLSDLFDDPETLVDVLARSSFINVDHPRSSQIFDAMSFAGPMYKIFTEDEKSIILDWIESLQKKPEGGTPSPVLTPQEAAANVLSFLQTNATRAAEIEAHSRHTLAGRSITDWFDNPIGLMEALVGAPDWLVPFNSTNSHLYQLFSTGPMAFLNAAADIKRWIDTGAEIPKSQPTGNLQFVAFAAPFRVIDLTEQQPVSRPRASAFAQRRMLIGMGSVH
ncbi:LodA/GoxA family CTQ-dependent oxidase (plasmid) [Rhizobium leguminosarum]|jgi:hypothetical protein